MGVNFPSPSHREVCVTQVVSISSLKGGVGKTSVTLGLASAAAARGLSTLVVDLDPHGDASTGLAVSTHTSAGSDAATVLRSPKRRSVEAACVPAGWSTTRASGRRPRLDVVVGSSGSVTFDHLPPTRKNLSRLRTALQGTTRYDLVLIDCPPTLNTLTMIAWAASEKVLAVAEPSLFSVAGTERTMRAIARFESENEFKVQAASVVVNKVQSDSAEHQYRIEELQGMFGKLVVSPTINDAAVWQQIQGSASPVHSWSGDESAVAMAQAFDTILGGLISA
ncbi:ParA family protein [Kocuria sp. HSID16901]|uniref:ParA family protein n=1 Tax=Kocuria sp. HSID16901 TaxID=2419505 RepID=UPI00065F893F|nr:ParA family protein [Kocuria sp. HSID16901]RUQ20465.1 ParA family protein [Kocuria sp. HSID16901]